MYPSIYVCGWFITLSETNCLPMKIPIFSGKYHQNGGFSMAMLVSGRVGAGGFPAYEKRHSILVSVTILNAYSSYAMLHSTNQSTCQQQ